uniref:Uncharacterized protein n=1 Tax=Echinococcus canadensis TaxID=519352 RepID=A0A915EV39_9CEST
MPPFQYILPRNPKCKQSGTRTGDFETSLSQTTPSFHFLFDKVMDLLLPPQAETKMLFFQLTYLGLPGMFEEIC